jgi:Holliday junction resolvase RusA-like endonuclease
MPAPYVRWKRTFAFHARAQWSRAALEGPVRVAAEFITPTGGCRPDLDNALGAVLDALEGIVIVNDRQVRAGAYTISKGEEQRIVVEVEALAGVPRPTSGEASPRSKIGRNRPPQEGR